MKVLVTGGHGFVGRWLVRELQTSGHEVVATDRHDLDVTDRDSVERALHEVAPDAIAHLAAISFGPAARQDPQTALRITVGGTATLLEAVRRRRNPPAVLVTGSADVYAPPEPSDLPLHERSRLAPSTAYGLTKLAQEAVALEIAARYDVRVVVTRSFNHTGPGQREEFVVPAFAKRIRAYREGETGEVRSGNIDVRRDFTDVRDVVRAYRELLERIAHRDAFRQAVFNISSGTSVSIREIVEKLAAIAGVTPRLVEDPSLIRPDEPAEIVGDARLLRNVTGWSPRIPLDQTLRDVWRDVAGEPATS